MTIRTASCILALLLTPALPAQQPPTTSVEGTVRNWNTGEPIAGATLRLGRGDGTPGMQTTSGEDGRYSFRGFAPASYFIMANAPGFVNGGFGAKEKDREPLRIAFHADEPQTGLDIRLLPEAVIAGRVVDAEGDAVEGQRVRVLQSVFVNGRREIRSVGQAFTNDAGDYRINGLAAGRYFVSSGGPRPAVTVGPDGMPRPTPPGPVYEQIFYPAAPDAAAAAKIEIARGAVLEGVDLTLHPPKPGVRLTGRIANYVDLKSPRVAVNLLRNGVGMGSTRADAEGRFELTIAPGAYDLAANTTIDQVPHFALQPVEIGFAGLEDATLTLTPLPELHGSLRIDGDAKTDLASLQVQFQMTVNDGFLISRYTARPDANGDFSVPRIEPGKYRIQVSGTPPGFYLKSIAYAGADYTESKIDLTSGVSGALTLTISGAAASLTGKVNQPNATIVLVPESPRRRDSSPFYKVGKTDAEGRFRFNAVIPGTYHAYAWEDVESLAWMDPEFLEPLQQHSKQIQIAENSTHEIELTAIPADR